MASVTALFALAGLAAGATITTTEPALSVIEQARATTLPQTWTSDVKGKAFDRFYQVWLENVVRIRVLSRVAFAMICVTKSSSLRYRITTMLPMTPTNSGWRARELH